MTILNWKKGYKNYNWSIGSHGTWEINGDDNFGWNLVLDQSDSMEYNSVDLIDCKTLDAAKLIAQAIEDLIDPLEGSFSNDE